MNREKALNIFHVSVANAYIDEVEVFIKEKPKFVNEKGSNNSTSLHWASLHGSVYADELGTDTYYQNMLDYQADRDYLSVFKLLLDNGADIDAVGDGGWTPLHLSASYGRLDVVKLLVSRGANTEIKDARQRIAIDRALESGNFDIARYLESVLPTEFAGYVEKYRHSMEEKPDFKTYSDKIIAFKYPKDDRLIVNDKTKIYTFLKVKTYSVSLAFYPPEMMDDIKEELSTVV